MGKFGLPTASSAGGYGETAALGFLQAKGYVVLERNYKRNGGEIDIIAKNNSYIVFVEVKYRKGLTAGSGLYSVTRAKQRNIIRAALGYIAEKGLGGNDFRFDVMEVFGNEQLEINHLEDAFQ